MRGHIFPSYGAFRSPKAPSIYRMGQQLVLPLHNVYILEGPKSNATQTITPERSVLKKCRENSVLPRDALLHTRPPTTHYATEKHS